MQTQSISENPPYLYRKMENNSDDKFELVAHIKDGKIFFMEQRLLSIMRNFGIPVPPDQRRDFQNMSVVYLMDENSCNLFERAFRTIYFHLHMPKNEYTWLDKPIVKPLSGQKI